MDENSHSLSTTPLTDSIVHSPYQGQEEELLPMASRRNIAPAIGIDLGTTYSCVAVWQNNRVEIIPNDQGNRITPSSVAFAEDGRLLGDAAKNQTDVNPTNTVFAVKRLIGRRFSDSSVQNDVKYWPFKVVAGPSDRPRIVVNYRGNQKDFYAEEISSMILLKMKEVAETYLATTVKNAIITVPAYFSDSQRQATKNAGAIAGLNVIRIMDEPTAAAIAYGFDKITVDGNNKNVLVFDLGGGTFDVSLLSIGHGNFVVRATAGDTHLGGEDFDDRLVDHCVKEFKTKYKKDIIGNAKSLRRLRTACERAKRILSFSSRATIQVDCLYDGVDFSTRISQARFEELNKDRFMRCTDQIEECLRGAQIDKTGVDVVVLVGGSTRIPKVQQLVQDFFEGKELFKGIHPDEAVAYGAAIYAADLHGQRKKDMQNLVLVDVTPLSLGITVKIYEGESAETKYNNLLGEFRLGGIEPAPHGVPEIDAVLDIDANGILTVSAQVRSNGAKNEIVISKRNADLIPEEIQTMVEAAARYKAEDKELKMRISLEDFVEKVKTMAMDPGLSDPEKKSMEEAAENVIAWLETNHAATIDEINKQKRELAATIRRLMKLRRGGIPYDEVLLLSLEEEE
ncbi:Heat shock 70 kDa protein [Rhynchospora pubera]|uniref:Heat shock 70 kDa protein n=1 Tax=Rhynchospora pubera TaxID=906938 RepID=A0AAV8HDA0_9POAL|nr:Heat shock 70 kDa protein [Rhynchospora pubera]